MSDTQRKVKFRLVTSAMGVGLVVSAAAFVMPAYASCAIPRVDTHGSIQAMGAVRHDGSISCSPGLASMAQSEQAFHVGESGVQSGTHWILNK